MDYFSLQCCISCKIKKNSSINICATSGMCSQALSYYWNPTSPALQIPTSQGAVQRRVTSSALIVFPPFRLLS